MRTDVAAADGREATVTYAGPGDGIGLGASLVRHSPFGLQALEETTVEYFDAQRFEQELSNRVALAHTVAQWFARRMERSSQALQAFAFGRVRQRVAEHLICLAIRDRDGKLVAHVTQQGLADAVGSVRDVVARTLAELASAGIVITSHRRVVIADEATLRQEAARV
jgi:CRP/FNR family transcriptional regulator